MQDVWLEVQYKGLDCKSGALGILGKHLISCHRTQSWHSSADLLLQQSLVDRGRLKTSSTWHWGHFTPLSSNKEA